MRIGIIGAGIGGITTALFLQKSGVDVSVFEKTETFQPVGAGIGLGSNAMLALDKMGVSDRIKKAGMSLHEQRLLNANLTVMNKIDFSKLQTLFGEETITIQRAALHQALFDYLKPGTIQFNRRVTNFKQEADSVEVIFNHSSVECFDYVIAADGIHSVFRQQLVPDSGPRFQHYTCYRGTSINKGDVPYHIGQEAWSQHGRFGWAPLKNDEVYWFACVNAQERDEYLASLSPSGVANLFQHFPSPVRRLIQEVQPDSFLHHDIYDIQPLSAFVYHRIILLGDAAHATSPNMGQGAGQAIEDAYVLANAWIHAKMMDEILETYNKKRVAKTKKVIQLSRQIGKAAQWENPFLIQFRNAVLPFIPEDLLFQRLHFLFKT